jgi:hypothetical protein
VEEVFPWCLSSLSIKFLGVEKQADHENDEENGGTEEGPQRTITPKKEWRKLDTGGLHRGLAFPALFMLLATRKMLFDS